MMDKKLVFFENKSAKTAITGSAIDFGQSKPTTGLNERPLYVVIQASATLAGTGSLTVNVEDSDNGSSFTAAYSTAVAVDSLKGGKAVALPMPLTHRRFVRLTTTPSTITDGEVTAYLTDVVSAPTSTPIDGLEYIATAS